MWNHEKSKIYPPHKDFHVYSTYHIPCGFPLFVWTVKPPRVVRTSWPCAWRLGRWSTEAGHRCYRNTSHHIPVRVGIETCFKHMFTRNDTGTLSFFKVLSNINNSNLKGYIALIVVSTKLVDFYSKRCNPLSCGVLHNKKNHFTFIQIFGLWLLLSKMKNDNN